MRWFVDQLKQYSDEEKNAIKICAINFVNEDIITAPDAIIKNNKLYSQNRIIELCSAFYLMGKPKDACVTFVKQVFSESFANTEDSTITKKIIGPDKMMEIISTYQDAQRLDSNGAS